MKTVMVTIAFGAALVLACLLTTVFGTAKNEFPQSHACFSPASPSDALAGMAKVRHDNCASDRQEDRSDLAVLPA